MLLGVVAECSDRLLEAGLDQGHGGEGHAGAAAPLTLDGADVAESDGVVGGGHGGPAVSVGVVEPLGLPVIGQRHIVHPSGEPLLQSLGDEAGVVGLELVLGEVAVLVDLVKPGLVAG